MPQGVRADSESRAAASDIPREETLHAATREAPAASIHEERLSLEFGIWDLGFGIWGLGFGICDVRLATGRSKRPPVVEPGADGLRRGLVERHESLLAPLSHRADDPLVQIDVLEVEGNQLAQAQSGRVEQLE